MNMSRQPRIRSDSGYMHLIVRGIGKQILFETEADYLFFLDKLSRFAVETEVGVCAYCLMENHVHLLVHDVKGNAALLMKKLGVSYSRYYNHRYDRQGHLFQDRYMSEAIDDERYLMTVFRYILNNPLKAGICSASDYEWNSYDMYDYPAEMMDLALLREMIGDSGQYVAYIAADNDDRCLEYEAQQKDDDWAREIICRRLNAQSGTILQSLGRRERDDALRRLMKEGLSIRQIERLTGISRGVIQRVKT